MKKILCLLLLKTTLADREGYMNYEQMTEALQKYARDYPNLTKLFTIGQSVRGKELWVLEINITVCPLTFCAYPFTDM